MHLHLRLLRLHHLLYRGLPVNWIASLPPTRLHGADARKRLPPPPRARRPFASPTPIPMTVVLLCWAHRCLSRPPRLQQLAASRVEEEGEEDVWEVVEEDVEEDEEVARPRRASRTSF